jgi:hypothetical protein
VFAHSLPCAFHAILAHALGVNSFLPISGLSSERHFGSKPNHVILLSTELKNGLMLLKRKRDVNKKRKRAARSIGAALQKKRWPARALEAMTRTYRWINENKSKAVAFSWKHKKDNGKISGAFPAFVTTCRGRHPPIMPGP